MKAVALETPTASIPIQSRKKKKTAQLPAWLPWSIDGMRKCMAAILDERLHRTATAAVPRSFRSCVKESREPIP